jgi:predicted nucleic acid-binding protein
MFLLDTNVVSQFTKPAPHPVIDWVLSQREDALYISCATLLEIRYGIERRATGRKREELELWLREKLPQQFRDRIVPMEEHASDLAGRLLWHSESERWGMDELDSIIAACAMVNGLALATLNKKHFEPVEKLGLRLVRF